MNAIIKKTCNVLGWLSLVMSLFFLFYYYHQDGVFSVVTAFGVLSIVFFMKSK